MTDLKDKIIVVTGSSRGIGRSIALALAQKKAYIVVNYLKSENKAKELVDLIHKQGGQAQAVQADVRDFNAVKNMFAAVNKSCKRIDVLINNVGDFIHKPLKEHSEADWHDMIDSNLNSCFYCCQNVVPYMRKQKFGRIINIGLANAHRIHAFQNVVPYAIAKTGVLVLTKSLAVAEAENGITVNSVSPGLMQNGSLTDSDIKRMESAIPIGRVGNADDIIGAINYLLSKEAEYVTGSDIVVSGGWGI